MWGFYKDFAPDGAADGPRLCPQDQSQRVIGGEGLGIFCCVKMFGRAAADPAARDTAVLQPQRGGIIQPGVGVMQERLRRACRAIAKRRRVAV